MTDFEKDKRELQNHWPVVGTRIRRNACARIATRSDAEAVPLLVDALQDSDREVRDAATSALRSLKSQAAIDALCELWVKTKTNEIGLLIAEHGYVAAKPLKTRVRSALKAGKSEIAGENAAAIPHLVEALKASDADVNKTAQSAVRELSNQDAIDAFCALWVKDRAEALGSVIADKSYVAVKPPNVRVLSALKAKRIEVAGESAAVVPILVGAFADRDLGIVGAALAAAGALQDQAAIDAFCALWAKDRNPALGEIVAAKRYVATKPPELRALSALKSRNSECLANDPDLLDAVVHALEDRDRAVSVAAEEALRAMSAPRLVDRLCTIAFDDLKGRVARLCIDSGKRPSAPEDRAIFLFATSQLDAYFKEDDDFQDLWAAFERAPQDLRDRVLEIARSGDHRAGGFFRRRKRPLSECTDREIRHGIEVALRDRDWLELFRMMTQMPLRYGYPLLDEFRASGWEPEDEDQRKLLREILRQSRADSDDTEERQQLTSSVFGRWIAEGEAGWKKEENVLLKRLDSADPPDGVRIVAALSAKGRVSTETRNAVEKHRHWLVRLAGYATGLLPDWSRAKDDPVYWVREVGGAGANLEFWPVKATPDDIERLDDAPREAWAGKAGRARKVLRLLMAHRMTMIDIEEVTIVADESAVDIEDVV